MGDKKIYKLVENHKIICCRNKEDCNSSIQDEESALEKTISELMDDSEIKKVHIAKMKNESQKLIMEATRAEEELERIIKLQEKIIIEFRKELCKLKEMDESVELTKLSLLRVKTCLDPRNATETTRRKIQLIQKRQYVGVQVYTCLVVVQQFIQYCGMHFHTSSVAGGLGKYVHYVSAETCLKAYQFRHLDFRGIGGGIISKISLNGTTEVSTTLQGHLDISGKCEGIKFTVGDTSYENVVVSAAITIKMSDYFTTADVERNVVNLRSGTICPYNDGSCFDDFSGEAIWKEKIADHCTNSGVDVLYEGNATLLILARIQKHFTIEGKWVELTPALRKADPAIELDANTEDEIVKLARISPITSDGIYTREDMEKFQRTLMFPNEKKAVTNEVARRVTGRGRRERERKTSKEWLEEHKWEKVAVPTYEVDTQTAETSTPSTNVETANETRALEIEQRECRDRRIAIERTEKRLKEREETLKETEEKLREKEIALEEMEKRLKDMDKLITEREEKISRATMGKRAAEKPVTTLKGMNSLEKWRTIAHKNWDERLWANTETKKGNPIQTKDEVVKVVLVNKQQLDMNLGIQRLYRERYPELLSVTEDFDIMEQSTKMRSKDGYVLSRRKIVKITHDGTEDDTWNKLVSLKAETTGTDWVALHKVNHIKLDIFRKMVECIFHDTNTKVVIYTDQEPKPDHNPKTPMERSTYALVVNTDADNYKNTLRTVKDSIQGNEACSAVKSIKSTREGKLLITVDKDQRKLDQLEGLIREVTGSTKIRKMGETFQEILHIRGMDAEVKKHEVAEAIEKHLSEDQMSKYALSELRPNARNTQAITVTTNKVNAEKLLAAGKIRIGIGKCDITRKVDIKKCRRCWGLDHLATECSGPDRTRHCFNCGKADHSSRDCKNEENCPMCEADGKEADHNGTKMSEEKEISKYEWENVKDPTKRRQSLQRTPTKTRTDLEKGQGPIGGQSTRDRIDSAPTDNSEYMTPGRSTGEQTPEGYMDEELGKSLSYE
ncbi:unnamed protein product [Phaedon cochleariae]|uniref:CCHC-type domain-containing protein n=1 Tax=Phaedon cochleariae TaxID=80249 RepID=A0A9N9SN13_PHACE|nr:unnamed protein product [Phaedon cochleariae]